MKKIIIIGCILAGFSSCYNDKYNSLYPEKNSCDVTSVTYATDVLPILNQSCNTGSCHSASGTTGFNFTDTSILKKEALNGDLVSDINFAPNKSNHNNMPLGGTKLSQCSINKITRWVSLGANVTGGPVIKPCDTTGMNYSYATDIKPIFVQSCNFSTCHNASGITGFDFTDTTVLKTQAMNGNIVDDITWTISKRGHKPMPLYSTKLDTCTINKIARWISLGANCNN